MVTLVAVKGSIMKILKVSDCCGGFVDCLVDDDVFEIAKLHRWCLKGKNKDISYVGRSAREGKSTINVRLHREVAGALEGECVDHVNQNKLDNRRSNLRLCSHSENMRNIVKNRGECTYKGVSIDRRLKYKKYRSTIKCNGKYINLGYFSTEKEAAIAYNKAAKELHGEFACLNVICD